MMVITAHDLAAVSAREHTAYVEAERKAAEAGEALTATFTPEQRRLFGAYADAMVNSFVAGESLRDAELRRHVPGMATALAMLAQHVDSSFGILDGPLSACCTDAAPTAS